MYQAAPEQAAAGGPFWAQVSSLAHLRGGCFCCACCLLLAAAALPALADLAGARHSWRTGGVTPASRHSSSYAVSARPSSFLAPSNTDSLTPAGRWGAGVGAKFSWCGTGWLDRPAHHPLGLPPPSPPPPQLGARSAKPGQTCQSAGVAPSPPLPAACPRRLSPPPVPAHPCWAGS